MTIQPMFKIKQMMPHSVEAFVWTGEQPQSWYLCPARVVKAYNRPALIYTSNLDRSSVAEAREHMAIVQLCMQLAQDLDAQYPDGVPSVIEHAA